jgi:MFS family permease
VFPVALLLMVVIGYGAILMMATANTTIQLAVPDALRGRVMSFYTTIFASSAPIGGLLFGAIASAAGVVIAVALGGVLAALIGVGAMLWLAAHRRGAPTIAADAAPAPPLPPAS